MMPKLTFPDMYQHLSADNDNNGNPRRLYVVMNAQGDILEAIDEGYEGFPKRLNGLIQLPEYPISVKLYKQLLKDYPEKT